MNLKKYKVPEEFSLIFLHHPRTAGSTITKIFCEEYIRVPKYCDIIGGDRFQPSEDTLSRVMPKNPDEKFEKAALFITGHTPFGLHELIARKSIYFSIFREPLDKVVSEYYNNIKLKSGWYNWASSLPLKDYIENGCDERNWHIENGQVKLLAPAFKRSKYGELPREALEIAKQNVKKYINLIGIQERFDESVMLLKHSLNLKTPYYTRQHIGGKRPDLSSLPKDTVDTIYRYNEFDRELYAYVCEIFDEAVRGLGKPFQDEVAKYKKDNKHINDLLREGRELYSNGSADALSVFEEILKIYPVCSEAHSFIMALSMKADKLKKTKEHLDRITHVNDQNSFLVWGINFLRAFFQRIELKNPVAPPFPVKLSEWSENFDNALLEKRKPKVSVLIICKNSEKTIRRCLNGIVSQDYDNIELIIQDGLSLDKTLEIISEFTEKYSFIKLYSEADKDADEAFFRGLLKCSGDLITLCWADEEFLPGAISWGVEKMEDHPELAAVYGDIASSDLAGNITTSDPYGKASPWDLNRFACWELFPNYCASFFRTSALRMSGFFERYRHDWDCIMYDYFALPGIRYPIKYFPGVLGKFAIHSNQLSTKTAGLKKLLPQLEHSLDKLLAISASQPNLMKLTVTKDRAMGGFRASMLPNLITYGTAEDTKDMLIDALKHKPEPVYLSTILKKLRGAMSVTLYHELLQILCDCDTMPIRELLAMNNPDIVTYLQMCEERGRKITIFPGGTAVRRGFYLWKLAFPELIRGWYDEFTEEPICGMPPLENVEDSKNDTIMVLADDREILLSNRAREIFGKDATIVCYSCIAALIASPIYKFKGDISPLEERCGVPREALLFKAYMEQLLMRLFEKMPAGKSLALYGGGQHTKWLMGIFKEIGHLPSVVIDDNPENVTFSEIPVDRPENIAKYNIAVILISNDHSHYQMALKLKKILAMPDVKIIDPYADLPRVPYPKLHWLKPVNWDSISVE